MKESTFKYLLEKYEKGKTTSEENALLEKFDAHFIETNEATIFQSQLHKNRVQSEIYRFVKRSTAKTPINWYKIAASIIVLIGVGLSTWFAFNPKETISYILIATNENEIKNIVLQDSSVVTLNENSQLRLPNKFPSNSRHVILNGEAYFKISKDKKRPFTVTANNIITKVLGTQFNIKMDGNIISVALVEGSVDVKGLQTSKVLKPNEKINFNLKNKKIDTELFNPKEELLWMTKTMTFNNTSLLEIVKLLEKKFEVSIDLENSILNDVKVSGTFANQSLTSILMAVTKATNLTFKHIAKNQILIYNPQKKTEK
ncbi:FecR family protein [Joostella atrarenae]|uniref:FecR family protein n=1 Tax=Joostella atrarenae TaxID=679257 RepID=A0ABS9J3Z2_9FLAO|nr:FecR family protein [Joostella atrarenae]MCF8715148.1 FecR family protein [Joostella atrarenae]